jgi:hypothetical protein
MTCVANAVHVDLRFGDSVRKNLDVNGSVRTGDLTCQRLHLFR